MIMMAEYEYMYRDYFVYYYWYAKIFINPLCIML